jgi:N-formylglutamate deformylase
MEVFRLRNGTAPLLVSMPHVGTFLPEAIAARLTPIARTVPDTDWHLDRLYDFLDDMGASVLVATHSRYVVDLNRPEDDASLYPGQDTTGLFPLDTFAREPLYAGAPPDAAERADRVARYWRPYHAALRATLAAVRARHGVAVLWDAHSIRSEVPRFFSGKLPDLNLGTAGGASCDARIGHALAQAAAAADGYTHVMNGRFRGGYITRRYGRPADGVHAVQLELSEVTYMDEDPPFAFREDLAERIRPVLRTLVASAVDGALDNTRPA